MGSIKPQIKILAAWRILLALLMIVPAFLTTLLFRPNYWVWFGLTAGWVVFFLAMYLVYLPLRFQKLSFSVTNERILLYSGVFYTRVRSIPLGNIQFTSITRNPFDRIFGLSSLVVTAAGGRIVLPGLRLEDARSLEQALIDPHDGSGKK